MRATLSDAGIPQAAASYDAWGMPETPLIGSFGFTGELQQGNDVWLRARWYGAGRGSFGSRDPYAGDAQTPYSLMPYQYAYANPALWTDARGQRASRSRNPPKPRIDVGLLAGFSGSGTIGFLLPAGMNSTNKGYEAVFDLYDFEVAAFIYTGIGASSGSVGTRINRPGYCIVSVGLNGYIGYVTGWRKYQEPGIQNYQGIFIADAAGFTTPLGIVGGQGFSSLDGKMRGAALSLGIGNDKIPFGVSEMRNAYLPPIPTSLIRFHGFKHGEPLPPTPLETAAFIYYVTLAFGPLATTGGGLIPLTEAISIIKKNARRWNDEYEQRNYW